VAGYDPTDPRAISSPYLSAQGHNVLDVKFCKLLYSCLLDTTMLCSSSGMRIKRNELGACVRGEQIQAVTAMSCQRNYLMWLALQIHVSAAHILYVLSSADGPMKLFGEDASYSSIAEEIEKQAGVITHGLFVNVADSAAMFTEDGIQLFQSAAVV
jgi:hypothetical protein